MCLVNLQGLCDGLVHLPVHGLETHRALNETVDAQLVVQHPTGALAGRYPREDQHRLPEVLLRQIHEELSLLVGQVHFEGHVVLRVVENLQQTPRPGQILYATKDDIGLI